jgi:hypothetical protein
VNLLEDMLLRAIVWALIGVLFGSLYVLLVEAMNRSLPAHFAVTLAIIGAAALTALFYGSMRLTVIVGNFTLIAVMLFSWLGPRVLDLTSLVFIGAGVGLAVGAGYGAMDRISRVFCAEAKIIAGALAGVVGGLMALLLMVVMDGIGQGLLAMAVAPVAILTYLGVARWFVTHCHRLVPPLIDGAVVGLGVGSITGLVFLILAGTLDLDLLGSDQLRSYVSGVQEVWGTTMLGCALVCLPVGVVRSLIRAPWYNL